MVRGWIAERRSPIADRCFAVPSEARAFSEIRRNKEVVVSETMKANNCFVVVVAVVVVMEGG